MSEYTLVFPDDYEAAIQQELAQRRRETPTLSALQLVQERANQHWRDKAFDMKEAERNELVQAILSADVQTVKKVKSDLGLK